MYPVCFQKVDEEHDGAQAPGERIRPKHGLNLRDDPHGNGDIADTDHAPADHHDQHRHDRFPGAAQDAGNAVREGEQEVKQRDGVRLHDAEGDDVRFSVKERDQHRRGKVNRDTDQLRQCDGADNAKVCAFLCTVILLCAKVLTDKGGQRHREAGDRQKTKALDLRVGTAACHRRRPEGVDIGLHDYVCD